MDTIHRTPATEKPSPALDRPLPSGRLFRFALGLAGVLLVVYLDGLLQHVKGLPTLSRDMSYGLLFVVGLFTGFHCVGMCGAMVLSYTVKSASGGRPSYRSHLLYGAGKTLSYTTIGAAFGGLGSAIAFTPLLRGTIGVVAGIFLILFGLGMLNIWPALRNFRVKTPLFLLRFIGAQSQKSGHPFIIGCLNGLMILCGPLQAMYIMAAGSGSALRGGTMLFFFGLGTLPMMMGFGLFAGLASQQLAPKLIKASAAIVVVLGAVMLNRGLEMSGSGLDFDSVRVGAARMASLEWNHWRKEAELAGIQLPELPIPAEKEQGQAMERLAIHSSVRAGGAEPGEFRLQAGVPVRWTIDVYDMSPETARVAIPEWGLDRALQPGRQVVEFTPPQAGIVTWHGPGGVELARFLVEDPQSSLMHMH